MGSCPVARPVEAVVARHIVSRSPFLPAAIGRVVPRLPLRRTPLTLSAAMQRGYSPYVIESYLAVATGHLLDAGRQQQLLDYWGLLDAYRVEQVYLLSTRQPGQLAEIAANSASHLV